LTSYTDASVLVAAFTPEPNNAVALRWLQNLPRGSLVSSRWCETEVASALAIKVRTGQLAAALREQTFDDIRDLLALMARVLPVHDRLLMNATRLIRSCPTPLRGGDALHLAIADDASATCVTFDNGLARAGEALGISVRLLA
jgi:uncharacterized protein